MSTVLSCHSVQLDGVCLLVITKTGGHIWFCQMGMLRSSWHVVWYLMNTWWYNGYSDFVQGARIMQMVRIETTTCQVLSVMITRKAQQLEDFHSITATLRFQTSLQRDRMVRCVNYWYHQKKLHVSQVHRIRAQILLKRFMVFRLRNLTNEGFQGSNQESRG